jgi:hypothetical protein
MLIARLVPALFCVFSVLVCSGAAPAADVVYVNRGPSTDALPAVPQGTSSGSPLLWNLTGYAGGLYVDSARDLYVLDGGNAQVDAFHFGAQQPFLTFPTGSRAQTLCGNGTSLYVTDDLFGALAYSLHGEAQGSFSDPNGALFVACAADAAGDLFLSYITSADTRGVDEFVGGQAPPVTLFTRAGGGPIALDAKNELVVAGGRGVRIYPPPYVRWTRAVTFTTPPLALAFSSDGTSLWAVEGRDAYGYGKYLEQRSYPAGTLLGRISTLEHPLWLTVSP